MVNQSESIKVEKNSVLSAAATFGEIGDSYSCVGRSLADVDSELIATWKGEAGNKFEFASICIEKMLADISKKNAKLSGALVDLTYQFHALDEELANGLSVNVQSAKGVN